MKTQLIMLSQPILVSDEEIKEGDKCLANAETYDNEVVVYRKSPCPPPYVSNLRILKKIIAGIPELPSIDLSALSEEDCKKIGWVDVEKLAVQDYKQFNLSPHHGDGTKQDYYDCFLRGFNAAQSLNEKKFSEEDLRKSIDMARSSYKPMGNGDQEYTYLESEIIQSVSQPKVFDVEVEMETIYSKVLKFDSEMCKETHFVSVPKITNNSIKILKVL